MSALLPGRLVETGWQVPADAAVRALAGERLELVDTCSAVTTQKATLSAPFAISNFRRPFISVERDVKPPPKQWSNCKS